MFSACLTAAAQGQAAQAQPDVAQVVSLLRQQRFSEAQAATQRLLTDHPRDCRLLSLDGLAFNGMNRPSDARHAFDRALRACPDDLLALEGAAQIAYAQKQPDAAALLERVLALRPTDPTTHAMLASVDRTRGNCSAALPHFEASQGFFAEHPQLQEGYAFCLAQTGDEHRAEENYQEVLARHPDDKARYNLAIVQWKLHESQAALSTLQPLLTSDAEAPLELGSRIAEDAGNTPQAVQLLRQAILRQPDNPDNYLRFAQLSFNHSSPQVGVDMLDAGIRRLPHAARLYVARGVLEVQLSQFEKGIADFEEAHRLEPQLSLAMDAMGIVQSQQHQSDASLNLFREQARLHPRDSLLQYLYAEALSESESGNGRVAEAITAAERSVTIDPQYEPARDLLALLYLRADKPDRAAAQAEAALKIDPSDDTALYQEIMAKRRLGQTADVQKLVQQLTALRAKNAERDKQKSRYVLRDETSQESMTPPT